MRHDYDLVILDCPPSISLASEAVIEACDALLVPVIPTPLSLRTLSQLDGFIRRQAVDVCVLPFFSLVHARRRIHIDFMQSLRARDSRLLQTVIPASSTIERVSTERSPVAVFAPKSTAAKAFRSLWREMAETLLAPTKRRRAR